MKVFIAFLICIVAVFGGEAVSEREKKTNELLKQAIKACVQELKLDPQLINEASPDKIPPSLHFNSCYYACVDRKMGVMNEDGTYSLEHILTFMDTAEEKKRAEVTFNTEMKQCNSIVDKNPCKMAACFHQMPEFYDMKDE